MTVGLLGVVFGLIEGQRYNWGAVWGSITIPEIIGAGLLVLVLFLVTQARRQSREPLIPFAIFRDRNFTLMALVLAALGFAMLGLFLPLTIYYQSVLGLSALAAGLAIAPQPLAMMFSSPIAAGLSQRVNGKYLLIPGLVAIRRGHGVHRLASTRRREPLELSARPDRQRNWSGLHLGARLQPGDA